jgi:hypothetical protein
LPSTRPVICLRSFTFGPAEWPTFALPRLKAAARPVNPAAS